MAALIGVAGTISGKNGIEDIQLNNAATEATLRLLLQSSLTANSQTLASIKALAVQSGLNVDGINDDLDETGETIQRVNSSYKELKATTQQLTNQFNQTADFLAKFTNNTAQASDVFASMSKLPLGIGLVASAFQRLAIFQETNLRAYQTMSSAGVNFAGSLTDMRLAAQQSFVTLDQFSNIMKSNGETFALMGGTVNDGAAAFAKMSNSLISSEAGKHLLNLGYTTEQVNTGMANYISMTGSRTKKEMSNTAGLISSSVVYMEQLDGLARITGKNREEQEKALKEAALNSAWQSKMSSLGPEEQKKATVGMANALATGGKGAMEAFQARIMGVPPMTKASQMFSAVMAQTNAVVMKSAANVTDSSKTVDDQNKLYVKSIRASESDLKKFGTATQYALIVQGDAAGQQVQISQAAANRTKNQTDADINQSLAKKKIASNEVENAVQTKIAMDKLGQEILNTLMPAIALLTPWIAKSAIWLAGFAKTLSETPNLMGKMIAVIALTTIAFIALKASIIAQAMGGAGSFLPMLMKGILGGAAGAIGGFALDYASDKLKESGHEKAGAAASIGSSAAYGAGVGAMIGAPFLGIGAAPGAAIGGAIGGAYGMYQNWKPLTGDKTEEKKPKESEATDTKLLLASAEAALKEAQSVSASTNKPTATIAGTDATTALHAEVSDLNKSIKLLLMYMKTTADNTERTYRAINNSGNQFAHN